MFRGRVQAASGYSSRLSFCFHFPQLRLGKFLNISGGVLEGDDLAATDRGIGSKNR